MKEVWKPVCGYEGLYEVSNMGRVASCKKIDTLNRLRPPKILSASKTRYFHVRLSKNGVSKTFLVHRLVAEAFLPNPNKLPIINHKDENPHNNAVTNLEWCTSTYNNNYGAGHIKIAHTKGTPVECYENGCLIGQYYSMAEAMRQTGVNTSSIWTSIKKKKPVGIYQWKEGIKSA